MTNQGVNFQLPSGGQFSVAVDNPDTAGVQELHSTLRELASFIGGGEGLSLRFLHRALLRRLLIPIVIRDREEEPSPSATNRDRPRLRLALTACRAGDACPV